MAKEKGQKKEEQKKEDKEILTVASKFQKLGKEGRPSRKQLAEDIIKDLADKGITVNGKGKPIRLERVQQQISAMVRDIKNNRGAKTKSWWSLLTVEESDKEFKLLDKPQMPQ